MGDTVYAIARNEHTSVAAIAKANPHIEFRRLLPGTTITIPVPHAAAAPQSAPAAKKHGDFAPKPAHVIRYAGTAAAKMYPAKVVASGDAHRAQLAKQDLPAQIDIHNMIVATAKKYGVSPTLALGIAWQESGWQQSAVSVCDAIGTMQVMPETGSWASDLAGQKLDLLKPQDNITAGVVTLRYLTEHAKNTDEAIGSYYEGLGAVQEHGFYDDTRAYVNSVKAHMSHLSK